jgi:hypothetical protein
MSYSHEQIASVCHEANRALQLLQHADGIPVAEPWHQLDDQDRKRITAGVRAAIRGATPVQLHEEWREALTAEGWQFGLTKSTVFRTHPNLVPYAKLPAEQRIKDHLFAAIVNALASPGGSSVAAEHLAAHAPDAEASQPECPTVGRIVHYVAHGTPIQPDGSQAFPAARRAAVVTEVDAPAGAVPRFVLAVLNPTGMFFHDAPYDPGVLSGSAPALCDGKAHSGGSWHWPAR